MTAAAVAASFGVLSGFFLAGCGGSDEENATQQEGGAATTLPSLPTDAITYAVSEPGVTTAVNGVSVHASSELFASACQDAATWLGAEGSVDVEAYLASIQDDEPWNEGTPEFHAVVIAAAGQAASGTCDIG